MHAEADGTESVQTAAHTVSITKQHKTSCPSQAQCSLYIIAASPPEQKALGYVLEVFFNGKAMVRTG